MDIEIVPIINVHRKDRTIMKLKEYYMGIYYYDVKEDRNKNSKVSVNPYCFVQTLDNKEYFFTRREVVKYEIAKDINGYI